MLRLKTMSGQRSKGSQALSSLLASDGTLANRVEGMSEEAYLRKGSGPGCQLHMQVEEYFIDIVGPSEPIVRQFAQDALGSLPKQ